MANSRKQLNQANFEMYLRSRLIEHFLARPKSAPTGYVCSCSFFSHPPPCSFATPCHSPPFFLAPPIFPILPSGRVSCLPESCTMLYCSRDAQKRNVGPGPRHGKYEPTRFHPGELPSLENTSRVELACNVYESYELGQSQLRVVQPVGEPCLLYRN